MILRHLPILAILLATAITASAKAPEAPSNLQVRPLGVNAFLLKWKDNSNNEAGWEIRIGLGNHSNPPRFLLIPSPNTTSYIALTNDLPGKTLSFQLLAYNGASGAEVFSAPTTAVTAVALSPTTFGAPTDLTATTIDDGRIRIAWKDMSTSERGYEIQYRKKSVKKWSTMGTTGPDTRFSLVTTGLEPATEYVYRVRAFKGNPQVNTSFSNVASAQTRSFRAPALLVATPEGEGKISLKWRDRSSIESGFEIESKTGSASYSKLGEVGPNVKSTTPITLNVKTAYKFRVRAFRNTSTGRVYTRYCTPAEATTSAMIAPTGFTATASSDTAAVLTWTDASSRETGYLIEGRTAGTTNFNNMGTTATNATTYTIKGLVPGGKYDFRIRAANGVAFSAFTPILRVNMPGGAVSGEADPPIFWKSSFIYPIQVTNLANLQSITVTNLPTGLFYQSSTRSIRGTPTVDGVYKPLIKAVFNGGYQNTATLTLRIIRPPAAPIVVSAFDPIEVAAAATTAVSAAGRFSDPDTTSARRITTSVGAIDLILYPRATPVTVANFLKYADAGHYDDTFFHRSLPDFVVQGGGFTHNGSVFGSVTKFAAIQNEPGISNLAGTVAMAKQSGNPNSATSEFFFNVSDTNAPNLDEQNSGFSVFARVAGNGMSVVNQINDLPRSTYTVLLGGFPRTFEDLPMNTTGSAPAIINPSLLVKIVSVAPVAVLRYQATSNNSQIATTQVNGSNIQITGVASGSTSVTVTAIDLDGQSVSQSIPVVVP